MESSVSHGKFTSNSRPTIIWIRPTAQSIWELLKVQLRHIQTSKAGVIVWCHVLSINRTALHDRLLKWYVTWYESIYPIIHNGSCHHLARYRSQEIYIIVTFITDTRLYPARKWTENNHPVIYVLWLIRYWHIWKEITSVMNSWMYHSCGPAAAKHLSP